MTANAVWLRRGASMLYAMLFLTVATSAIAAGYYRWTDDEGEVQFTQQPPDGQPYQFIRTSTGAAVTSNENESVENTDANTGKTAAEPVSSFEGLPPKDPAQCQQARDNLNVLQGSARIRSKGADGEYRFLTPEEIGEQKSRAQEAIAVFCD